MTLAVDDFSQFFAEINGGAVPYTWQRRLLESVVAERAWPERLLAPTGAGKTAVIEIHVFANALAVAHGFRIARRLCLVVGRRALVDSQSIHARRIVRLLQVAEPGTVAERVAHELGQLSTVQGAPPLGVTVLRGGAARERDWIDDATACRVLCMTPDMFGSRLLFRGYGTSWRARPREAGLLAYDTTVVLDEAHLNRQLARTVRRIREFAAQSPLAGDVPPVALVESSATLAVTTNAQDDFLVDLQGNEGETDRPLRERLQARKPLEIMELGTWPLPRTGPERRTLTRSIAQRAQELRAEVGGTVGVVVNRVRDALDIAEELDNLGLQTRSLVGPMRPYDRDLLMRDHPALLTPDGDAQVDLLVATQTIEVGVDLDLHGLITDIASAPALVQRFGRVNRRGRWASAPVVVMVPSSEVENAAPYTDEDMTAARSWLERVAAGARDVGPASLTIYPTPEETPRRTLFHRLEPSEAELLSRTSERMFAEPELDFWIRDSLEPEGQTISVVGRRFPEAKDEVVPLLRLTPPAQHEQYPSRRATVVEALKAMEEELVGRWSPVGEIEVLPASDLADTVRSGDTVILPAHMEFALRGVFVGVLDSATPLGDVANSSATHDDTSGRRRSFYRVAVLDPAATATETLLCEEAGLLMERDQEVSIESLAERMDASAGSNWRAELGLPDTTDTLSEINVAAPDPIDGGACAWVVLNIDSVDDLAEEDLQIRSQAPRVLLLDHQEDVASRALKISELVGMDTSLATVLQSAGRHHDDGKAHPLFQQKLGLIDGEPPLAKGMPGALSKRNRTASAGLPDSWRHEQLSVLCAVDALPHEHRELALRLIGTSHGLGRAAFEHDHTTLLDGLICPEIADFHRHVFDAGGWEEIIERTDAELGLWGAAYLEAILRAADCQVSSEGR